MTKEEFLRRVGTFDSNREEPSGYYEIDLDAPAVCEFEQTPALLTFMLLTGMLDYQSGWNLEGKAAFLTLDRG